jgi:hypothetical protein
MCILCGNRTPKMTKNMHSVCTPLSSHYMSPSETAACELPHLISVHLLLLPPPLSHLPIAMIFPLLHNSCHLLKGKNRDWHQIHNTVLEIGASTEGRSSQYRHYNHPHNHRFTAAFLPVAKSLRHSYNHHLSP